MDGEDDGARGFLLPTQYCRPVPLWPMSTSPKLVSLGKLSLLILVCAECLDYRRGIRGTTLVGEDKQLEHNVKGINPRELLPWS
jgi:hypothetical protein